VITHSSEEAPRTILEGVDAAIVFTSGLNIFLSPLPQFPAWPIYPVLLYFPQVKDPRRLARPCPLHCVQCPTYSSFSRVLLLRFFFSSCPSVPEVTCDFPPAHEPALFLISNQLVGNFFPLPSHTTIALEERCPIVFSSSLKGVARVSEAAPPCATLPPLPACCASFLSPSLFVVAHAFPFRRVHSLVVRQSPFSSLCLQKSSP